MSKITSLSFFQKKTRAVRVWFKEEITIFSVFESDDTPIHYKFKVFRKNDTRINYFSSKINWKIQVCQVWSPV